MAVETEEAPISEQSPDDEKVIIVNNDDIKVDSDN